MTTVVHPTKGGGSVIKFDASTGFKSVVFVVNLTVQNTRSLDK
jgi:hypothetical protein